MHKSDTRIDIWRHPSRGLSRRTKRVGPEPDRGKGRSPSTEDRAGEQMKRLDRGTDKTAFEETDGNGPVCSVFCR